MRFISESVILSDAHMKTIIYQVMTRLWGEGKFSSFGNETLSGIKSFGADCIWFTGIPRHSSGKDFVKGNPGCPYSISDWKDVNPYLADNPDERIAEFRALVERCHSAGLKVITDYIPNHVSKDYEGPVPVFGWHDYDWSDTVKVNWSDPSTVPEMISVLKFWKMLGVDGFRCDMVELVAAEKLGEIFRSVRNEYPDTFTIAEVYNKDNFRKYLTEGSFDLLYDKSGTYDILRGIKEKGWSAEGLSWNWQWLSDMQPRMLNFLENHDEQRVMFWSGNPYWAGIAFALLFNDSSFMYYHGEEAGESALESKDGRTSIFNWCKPNTFDFLASYYVGKEVVENTGINICSRFRDLLSYARMPVFRQGSVWDLCYAQRQETGFDKTKHFAFLRYDRKECWLVLCNFSNANTELSVSIPEEIGNVCTERSYNLHVSPMDFTILQV